MSTPEIAVMPQTLAQRLTLGRIPVSEALRYGMILAESLRRIHDSGHAHGAVSPGCIAITRSGLELLSALRSAGDITPYTAPEVAQGAPADPRSDIFSFGAILYEMLTGRAAFSGDASPAPSGSPAVDRLVAGCVAKDPAARWPRMQKLLLELKLLAVAVQRAEATVPVRREVVDPTPAIRAELKEMETRITERLERSDVAVEGVHARISRIEELVQESLAQVGRVQQSIEERFAEFEQHTAEALTRADRVELAAESIRRDTAALRESVAEDLAMLDKSMKSQNSAIESARTAMAQTDDLVERVVEALESLQSVVLDGHRAVTSS